MNNENTQNKNFLVSIIILLAFTWLCNFGMNKVISLVLPKLPINTMIYRLLIYLLGITVYVIVAIVFEKLWEKKSPKTKLIIVISVCSVLIEILLQLFFIALMGWLSHVFYQIISYTSFLLWAIMILYVHRKKHKIHSATGNTNTSVENCADGYCNITKHILLLFFTFGIWLYIWIYQTTKNLNNFDAEHRNPASQLLLCMFVPFYIIFWTYKTAQIIDKKAKYVGVSSNITTICLILAILMPILPPIFIQDKLNAVVENSTSNSEQQNDKKATEEKSHSRAADEIKKYKELLDMGAISQEEFDAKKKQLLNL